MLNRQRLSIIDATDGVCEVRDSGIVFKREISQTDNDATLRRIMDGLRDVIVCVYFPINWRAVLAKINAENDDPTGEVHGILECSHVSIGIIKQGFMIMCTFP